MSQSDYIQYKKTQVVLKDQTKLQPILASMDYTRYETYAAETTFTTNTQPTLNQLIPTGSIRVMNMERKITNCPTFTICNDTNARTNRRTNNAGTELIPRPLRMFYAT